MKENESKISKTINVDSKKIFLRYFILFMIVTTLFIFSILLVNRNLKIKELRLNSEIQVNFLKGIIDNHFETIKSDLLFLPELNELLRYKEIPNEEDLSYIENEFLEFSKNKTIYDQIRYINLEGMEMVRINFNNGSPYIAEKDQLQNKKDRYYFYECLDLDDGAIYMSPLDLNKENGEIELPLKPMIRFGTPIYNQDNEIKAILILNYLADTFLAYLKTATINQAGVFSLINEEGYLLFDNNPAMEWSFMYPEKENINFGKRSPELWSQITDKTIRHQFFENEMMYTVMDILPLNKVSGIKNRAHWYLVNKIDIKQLGLGWKELIIKLFLYLFFSSIAIVFFTLILSRAIFQRNQFQEALHHSALFDNLTNLPNRTMLKLKAKQLFKESVRYNDSFALLFIDLDGFKEVNDKMGHDIGDLLLEEVALRLKKCVRDSDTVVRMGGDEFVILLHRLQSKNDSTIVAQKIIDSIGYPFYFTSAVANIGASIGIALKPADGTQDLENLLKQADKAMYQVKKNGKGSFLYAE